MIIRFLYLSSFVVALNSTWSLDSFLQQLQQKKQQAIQRGEKKDQTGIILEDPFISSAHFWPMSASANLMITDIISGHKGVLMDGARIQRDRWDRLFASTKAKDSFIILGDFNGTCFADPGRCIMGGLTVAFWLRLDTQDINETRDQYILSTGAQSINSRGFAVLNFHGKYVVELNTKDREWSLRNGNWVHVAFVWDNKKDRLTFFINGRSRKSSHGTPSFRPFNNFTLFTVSRPNNALNLEYVFPLQICFLALWDKPLNKEEIKQIYQNSKSIQSLNLSAGD